MIADDVNLKTNVVYAKVLVKPLVNLIWIAGIVFLFGAAVDALAGCARAAPARDATRTGMTLVLGIVLAAAVVLIVALPFLREPAVEDDRLDARGEDELGCSRCSRSATVRSPRSRSWSSTIGRAESATRTIASSSARSAGRSRPHCGRSSRNGATVSGDRLETRIPRPSRRRRRTRARRRRLRPSRAVSAAGSRPRCRRSSQGRRRKRRPWGGSRSLSSLRSSASRPRSGRTSAGSSRSTRRSPR